MTPQHLHLALHLQRDHQGTRALDKTSHDGVNSDRCGRPAGCDCKPTRQLARVPRIHARLAHSSLLLRARHLLDSPSRGLHACFCLASDLVSSHLSSARVPCAPHRPVPGACMPPSSFHGPPSLSLSPSLPPSLCALTGSRRSDKVGEVARHQPCWRAAPRRASSTSHEPAWLHQTHDYYQAPPAFRSPRSPISRR